jgi:hypothetical protein
MKKAAELFKLLSVDKRIEIIEYLKKGDMNVNTLREGYWVHYSLNREASENCRQRLHRICTCGCLQKANSSKRK